jgi:NAD(P)-dependent dehydrogenase (short-subunit alcohol dehydrogenase family)/acyl dehydratase
VTASFQTQDPTRSELSFSREQVDLFAAASGDRNPLHLDPGFARRTPFGGCVVHGALMAIGLLGSLPPPELERVRALRVQFAGPVIPGASYIALARPARRAGVWEAQLTGRGKVLARVFAGADRDRVWKDAGAGAPPMTPGDGAAGREMRLTPAEPGPGDLAPGRAVLGRYATGPGLAGLAQSFGAQRLDPALLEGLAWASYVVGMEVPGLHSLLAGITLARPDDPGAGPSRRQTVRVREHDPRTGQLVLDGRLCDRSGAALSVAKIECFALAPVGSPDSAALGLGRPTPADRGSAVVIGASRGFGAALTLALLARGWRVHAAYSQSSESAAELAGLAGAKRDRLHLHQLDARDPGAVGELARELAGKSPLAGLVLSAAPPPLPMGLTGESASELVDYVGQSLRLAAVPLGALLPVLGPEAWVLFCSSSAVLAPPRDWPHYVSAKGALEGLARWVAATAPGVRSVVVRPPAMRTELTNTPSGRIAAVATETVAARIADQLAGGQLPPGLSVLDGDALAEVPG